MKGSLYIFHQSLVSGFERVNLKLYKQKVLLFTRLSSWVQFNYTLHIFWQHSVTYLFVLYYIIKTIRNSHTYNV